MLLLIVSCSEFKNDYDFRNYLRDKHPYCVIKHLKELEPTSVFNYVVVDTTEKRTYVYSTGYSKNDINFFCVEAYNNSYIPEK